MANELVILGVFKLAMTTEIFEAQLPMYGDEDQCRDHFSNVVLIEAIAEAEGGLVDLISITQANGCNQAPWDEGLLSQDGNELLARKLNCVKGSDLLRFAFYIHFYDECLPLIW